MAEIETFPEQVAAQAKSAEQIGISVLVMFATEVGLCGCTVWVFFSLEIETIMKIKCLF